MRHELGAGLRLLSPAGEHGAGSNLYLQQALTLQRCMALTPLQAGNPPLTSGFPSYLSCRELSLVQAPLTHVWAGRLEDLSTPLNCLT